MYLIQDSYLNVVDSNLRISLLFPIYHLRSIPLSKIL